MSWPAVAELAGRGKVVSLLTPCGRDPGTIGAPKEQPPRNLSGTLYRTDEATLESRCVRQTYLTDGENLSTPGR